MAVCRSFLNDNDDDPKSWKSRIAERIGFQDELLLTKIWQILKNWPHNNQFDSCDAFDLLMNSMGSNR